ncbi:hypothetical protein [Haloprofundus sp. MHR1]|uniref:hypothetical protein n=1 Tax=Haloprofundus sp. MHR1 TaxID=2572921 RepID=UPI0010BF50C8|nr:hypothetical protein [Haloprofundus sp. MHR1]QCJ48423.1 hypothetical protein FCF25_15365 [Haloprofundus sp. MHR1]
MTNSLDRKAQTVIRIVGVLFAIASAIALVVSSYPFTLTLALILLLLLSVFAAFRPGDGKSAGKYFAPIIFVCVLVISVLTFSSFDVVYTLLMLTFAGLALSLFLFGLEYGVETFLISGLVCLASAFYFYPARILAALIGVTSALILFFYAAATKWKQKHQLA